MTQPMIFVDLLLLLLLTPPHLGARHMSRLPAGSQYTSITADLEKDDLPCMHLTRSTLISQARVQYAYVCCCCCIQGTICRPCGLDRVLNQGLLCRRCPQPTIHQFENKSCKCVCCNGLRPGITAACHTNITCFCWGKCKAWVNSILLIYQEGQQAQRFSAGMH